MRITVIICTFNRPRLVVHAIESVLAQSISAGAFEIVVVDNSDDPSPTEQYVSRHSSAIRIRHHIEPIRGLSNARNAGTLLALGPIVAFLDDDATARQGWLEALLAARAAFPDAGAIGGRVIPNWVEPRPPWMHDDLLGYFSIVDWGGETRTLREREWLAGANISFRKADLIACAGFSRALGRQGPDNVL
ncbi:MAG: glycosyltransferase family A protein, partial [Alphaproteobacteria bacterium]